MYQRPCLGRFAFALVWAAALAFEFSVITAAQAAAARFPYAAVVNAADAQFRSGPGESYYPTSDAAPGQTVEVYHEDGDWSAVRPPRGSHSWVAAKLLKLPSTLRLADNADLASPVAVDVAVENAPAYIGSNVAPDRDAVAVRLHVGERVWVLSAEQADGNTWIKIAPPSGEFRWIETRLLRPKANSAAGAASEPETADETGRNDLPIHDAGDDAGVATAAAQALHDERTDSTTTSDSASVPEAPPASAPQAAPPSAPPSAAASEANPARGFWTQLQALELELSMKIAAEPRQWKFDAIRRDAQNLYDGAKSDEEYDAARYLLAKLAQFESVRRERLDLEERLARREATANTTNSVAATNARAGRTATSVAGPAPPAAEASRDAPSAAGGAISPIASAAVDRYDAAGRLVSIPTSRPGAPSYAVVDERNIVLQYVSPAPRVNLQPYVGRAVGITGVAGPSPDAVRPHVMAKRIDLLDGPVRR